MGLWDGRVQLINRFASGIADLNMSRNPLSSEVILIFNESQVNQYLDSQVVETGRYKKLAAVYKNPDINYVQQLGDELLMDGDNIPWLIQMTTTGLPRIPRFNDCIIIDNIKYSVAMVKPLNRHLYSLIQLVVYPERTDYKDPLKILSVDYFINSKPIQGLPFGYDKVICLDILYSGFPVEYSFDNQNWLPFKVSKIPLFLSSEYGAVRQVDAKEASALYVTEVIGGEARSIPLQVILEGAGAADSQFDAVEAGNASEQFETLYPSDEHFPDPLGAFGPSGTFEEGYAPEEFNSFDALGAFDNYFGAFDGGFAKASFLVLYLRDKENNVVSKELE